MAAIPAGPFLADAASNELLNRWAIDPGPLAVGDIVAPIYLEAKRKRIEMVHTLDSTPAEKKTATDMRHDLEHRSMGLAGEVPGAIPAWGAGILQQLLVMQQQIGEMQQQMGAMQLQMRNGFAVCANASAISDDHAIQALANGNNILPANAVPAVPFPTTKIEFATMSDANLTALQQFYGLQPLPRRVANEPMRSRRLRSLASHLGLR